MTSLKKELKIFLNLNFRETVIKNTIKDSVKSKLLLASQTRCTFFVITATLGEYFLSWEDSTSTPRAIFLFITGFDQSSISGLKVYIRWSVLRTIVFIIAHLTINVSIRAIIVLQGVKNSKAFMTLEAVLVIPFSSSSLGCPCLLWWPMFQS